MHRAGCHVWWKCTMLHPASFQTSACAGNEPLTWGMQAVGHSHGACRRLVTHMGHAGGWLLTWGMQAAGHSHGACGRLVTHMGHAGGWPLTWGMQAAGHSHGACRRPAEVAG
eukprot:360572-Chlamydomonas_euryale.AAC.8